MIKTESASGQNRGVDKAHKNSKRRERKGKKRTPSGVNPDILPSASGLMPWQIRGSVPPLPPIPA